jgi:citrate lyase subunit beta/citryl-CoA lyase
MPIEARPRRSALYMPGSNARALEKARSLPADMLILDLEDAVAPDMKAVAREAIAAAVAAGYGRREVLLRVNGLETEWGRDDLAFAATLPVDGVLLPKVESAAMVEESAWLLERAGVPEHRALWCMMETPLGMLRAAEVAACHPRLAGLVMGTSDLANDLHARHTRDRLPLITGLGLCLLAARAHRLAILDGVHLDLNDDVGFLHACRQGLELGFDGKTLIHPKTIAAANRVFAPDDESLARARRITAAFEEAAAEGKAVVVVDGKLVELLHVAEARRVLHLAAEIDALERA